MLVRVRTLLGGGALRPDDNDDRVQWYNFECSYLVPVLLLDSELDSGLVGDGAGLPEPDDEDAPSDLAVVGLSWPRVWDERPR